MPRTNKLTFHTTFGKMGRAKQQSRRLRSMGLRPGPHRDRPRRISAGGNSEKDLGVVVPGAVRLNLRFDSPALAVALRYRGLDAMCVHVRNLW